MRVGDLIKELRVKHKLTQADLAKKLKVAPTSVSAWELHSNRPLIDKIVMMSELFEVPIINFFDEMIEERENSHSKNEQENLYSGISTIAKKHNLDLTDANTLDLLDSALDLIKRMKEK